MMKTNLEQALAYIEEAEELKPAIEKMLTIVDSYADLLGDRLPSIAITLIDAKAQSVVHLEEEYEFTRQEAIEMVNGQWQTLLNVMNKFQAFKS